MKKNYSTRIFNILAKRVFKISKSRKLGWKWVDAQKWTSNYLFQAYKGKPLYKIKVTEVDKVIIGILDKKIATAPPINEVCFSPFQIPTKDLKDINWWLLAEQVDFIGDGNLKIRIAIDNVIDTGIVKKFELGNLKDTVEDIRKKGFGSDEMISFKILVAPNKKDDGKACSYYVLATNVDSDLDLQTEDDEIIGIVTEEDLLKSAKERRDAKRTAKANKIKEKKSKSKIKSIARPKQVEGREEADKKLVEDSLKNLKELYAKGLITKETYKKTFDELKEKLERGGAI